MQIGDELRTATWETGTVEAIHFTIDPQPMYNFTVATAHTYFVSEGQWLVHNACDPNTNPWIGPVDEEVIIVDPKGNAIPVETNQYLTGSSDGRFVQVRDSNGRFTGMRIDGGHNPLSHPDPRAQMPHAHVPGITNQDGTPWLPIKH